MLVALVAFFQAVFIRTRSSHRTFLLLTGLLHVRRFNMTVMHDAIASFACDASNAEAAFNALCLRSYLSAI